MASTFTYDVSLSSDQLSELASMLDAIGDNLDSVCKSAELEVAEGAAQVARGRAKHDTGTLANSIYVEQGEGGTAVVCGASYGAFVEFGTGIGHGPSSATASRALRDSGWQINASGKGEPGWVYRSYDGFHRTHGQDGVGFMGAGADYARKTLLPTFSRRIREALG